MIELMSIQENKKLKLIDKTPTLCAMKWECALTQVGINNAWFQLSCTNNAAFGRSN